MLITGANTETIDQTPKEIFGRDFKSSDRVSIELIHNVHPYDVDMSFVVKMDQNDAATMVVDVRLYRAEVYSDCFIGTLFPLGEERKPVKLFRLLTQDMKKKFMYSGTRGVYR